MGEENESATVIGLFDLEQAANDVLLAIPKKFTKKFGKELSSTVVLKVPTARKWHVELKEEEGRLWFQKGWDDFVEYYSICAGYFLVFRYLGNSLFSVVICDDETAFEIDYPCDTDDLEERKYEIEGEDRKTCTHCTKALFSAPEPDFSTRSIVTKRAKINSDSGLGSLKQRKRSLSPSKSPGSAIRNKMKQDNHTGKRRKLYVGNETNGNERERNKVQFVDDMNAKDGLSNPDCLGNGEHTVFTSPKFASSLVESMDREQEFDPRVCYTGLARMFVDNRQTDRFKQEECDVFGSIFTRVSERDTLDSDFCPIINELNISPPPINLTFGGPRGDDTFHVKNKESPQESSSYFLSRGVQSNGEGTRNNKGLGVNSHCTMQEKKTGGSSILGLEPSAELVSGTRRPFSFSKKERAIIAATKFTSKNPFCIVIMQPTYVRGRYLLNISNRFARRYLKGDAPFVSLRVLDGRTWQVQPVFTIGGANVKLSKGWKTFVLDNHLEEEDICIFELVDRKHMGLKVSIFDHNHNPKIRKRATAESDIPAWPARNKQKEVTVTVTGEPVPICKKGAVMEDGAFKSENPFCEIPMRHSYVHEPFILNLPNWFARRYLKENVAFVTLRGLDGRTWQVRCAYRKDKFNVKLVGRGWKTFVLDNHLEENHTCVFELVDRNHIELKISILDPNQNTKLTKRVSAELDIAGWPARNKQKEGKHSGKKRKPSDEIHCTRQETATRVFSGLREKQQVELVSNPVRLLTVRGKERANVAVRASNSENPSCSVTMRPSYVHGRRILHLPKDFAKTYLKKGVQHLTIETSDGRTWPVVSSSKQHRSRLIKGWKEFVLDNHLEEDDKCIFELVDKTHQILKVFIDRVSRNPKQSKRISADSKSQSCKSSSLVTNRGKQKDDAGKKRSLFDSSSCLHPTESVTRRSVSFREKERDILEATNFTSKNPFCWVIMRPSYVRGWLKLRLQTRFGKKYLKEGVQHLTLQVSDGRTWPVMCSSVNREYILMKGWENFVLDNHLKQDDICFFELVDKTHKNLEVTIFRLCRDPNQYTRISAQSKNRFPEFNCLVRKEERQIEDAGEKRSSLNPNENNRSEQIGNEEGHFMFYTDDVVNLPKSNCQICSSSLLVRNEGKDNEDAGKEKKLFDSIDSIGENGFEQIENGEIIFMVDKNGEVYLSNSGRFDPSESIMPTPLKMTSDRIDDENWNKTNIFNDEQGGALGLYCPVNYGTTMSLCNATVIRPTRDTARAFENTKSPLESSSSPLYTRVQPKENNSKLSETAEDDSLLTKQESIRKDSLVIVKVQTDVSCVARRHVPTQKTGKSIIAARAFTSNNPVRAVSVQPTYVHGKFKLKIPSSLANKYLNNTFGFRLQLSNRGIANARCDAGQDLHIVAKSWKEFALDNHVNEDDVCIFELADRNHIQLKVSILRTLKHSLQLDE
ncbi:hypothetical protein IFM89_011886 [Coptis chinensis]|uniref:TF-B3 domain-containing protein n=1 Tax=Coptis chinensis TaxID=261450 RepID=A0A835I486_9MAGN|nr:hypothetical protein IFM89_011886 [Coptis chinensis]